MSSGRVDSVAAQIKFRPTEIFADSLLAIQLIFDQRGGDYPKGHNAYAKSFRGANSLVALRRYLARGLGMALLGFGEWNSLEFSAWWPIYLAGFFLFLGGLFLIWNGPWYAPVNEEPMPEADGVYLGKFNLNGYSLKTYERETVDGSRQFRLSAFPSITREQEAHVHACHRPVALVGAHCPRFLTLTGLLFDRHQVHRTNWAFAWRFGMD